MRWYKKILAVCSFCTLLTTVNCFAVSDIDLILSEDKNTCYKTFEVSEEEKNAFENKLEKEIVIDGNKYIFEDYTSTGGNVENTIDINTTKTIVSKTKNKEKIIEQLGTAMEYEKDGYIGEYKLNVDTLKIKTNYNGYKEVLIEENVEYKDLAKNDLNYIPKEITKDDKKLSLLKTEWKVQDTIMIGDKEVPNRYIAKCNYATKQRVDFPYTYTVTAEYSGTATKVEENPIVYKVEYKKEEVKAPEVNNKKENNIMPIVAGSTGIILIVVFFITGNVKVYNYKDGEWKKVGKTRMLRNNKISLNRFALFESTNKYKLELSKNLTRKKKAS